MTMALMTVSFAPGKTPSLEQAARLLGVQTLQMDAAFGVVPIDTTKGLFAVQVDADRAPTPAAAEYAGPWSNPRIASFGPLESESSDQLPIKQQNP